MVHGAPLAAGRETPTLPIRVADLLTTSFHALGAYSGIINASYQELVKKFQELLTRLWQHMLRKGWR